MTGNPRLRPRYFDEIDTVSGTPEADVFVVQLDDQIFFNPIITNEVEPLISRGPWWLEDDTIEAGQGRVIRKPGQGTAPPKEQPETTEMVVLNGGGEWHCFGISICTWVPNAEPLDLSGMPPNTAPTPIFDEDEIDILVYQEQERANYLDGFQAPTARSYTYIEDFEPIEDEIIVGDNPGEIEYEIDNSFMPMFGPSCFRINGEWICI